MSNDKDLQLLDNAFIEFKVFLLDVILLGEHEILPYQKVINDGRYRFVKTRKKSNGAVFYHFFKYSRRIYENKNSESININDLWEFMNLKSIGHVGFVYVVYPNFAIYSTRPENFIDYGRDDEDKFEKKKKKILNLSATDENKKGLWLCCNYVEEKLPEIVLPKPSKKYRTDAVCRMRELIKHFAWTCEDQNCPKRELRRGVCIHLKQKPLTRFMR